MAEDNKISDQIDLIAISKLLWLKRALIIKVVIAFLGFAVLLAFTMRAHYQSTSKLMIESLESDESKLGGLSGLAGLARISLDQSSSGVLSPELYPEIVFSTPFLLKMINREVHFEQANITTSSFVYLDSIQKPTIWKTLFNYTLGLPGLVKRLYFSSDQKVNAQFSLPRLSEHKSRILETFKKWIVLEVNSDLGLLKVSIECPDPTAATRLNELLIELLTKELTKYKLEKSKQNLDFVKNRFDESKENYEGKQKEWAAFADKNLNLIKSSAKLEEQRIRNEVDLAFEIYKGLASQLEQARIKIKEKTPVFTVLEPPRVPYKKSKPNKIVIIFVMCFFGLVFGSLLAILKEKTPIVI